MILLSQGVPALSQGLEGSLPLFGWGGRGIWSQPFYMPLISIPTPTLLFSFISLITTIVEYPCHPSQTQTAGSFLPGTRLGQLWDTQPLK